MTTVTVAALVAGDYERFLPGWLASVAGLSRRPDRVLVVGDVEAPAWADVVPGPGEWDWCRWRNAMAVEASTDYVAWVDVDDRYRPCALDGCDDWDADVIAFGMRVAGGPRDGQAWTPAPDPGSLHLANQVPNGSPVRVDVARSVGWDPVFWPFSDWGFWAEAAARGATFASTGRIDFDYRWHADTPQDAGPTRARIAERLGR